MAYTKLHSSILTSTVWSESSDTRVVFVTMLAMADKHGEVISTVPGLARMANVSLDAAAQAIETFLSPDPYSRTPDDDGRRIVPIAGGWLLLNHGKYRLEASKADQKAKTKERVRRFRERKRNASNDACNDQSLHGNGVVTHDRDIAEADTDSESEHESRTGISSESLSETESLTSTGDRRRRVSKTARPPQVSPEDFKPLPGRINGADPESPIPDAWKPTTDAQARLRNALSWMTPKIAELRMVEFRAWAEGKTFRPQDRDRVWLRFMLRTRPGDYADSAPTGFNG